MEKKYKMCIFLKLNPINSALIHFRCTFHEFFSIFTTNSWIENTLMAQRYPALAIANQVFTQQDNAWP